MIHVTSRTLADAAPKAAEIRPDSSSSTISPAKAATGSPPRPSSRPGSRTTSGAIARGCISKRPGSLGWHWSGKVPNGPFPDFSCEVLGRVTGDKPTSTGGMLIQVIHDDQGFQVRLDGTGSLFVEPSFLTAGKYPDGPRVGPIRHRAIQPGGADLNAVRLLVGRRRLEVLVNGARVCEPVHFDRDLMPAAVWLGVRSKSRRSGRSSTGSRSASFPPRGPPPAPGGHGRTARQRPVVPREILQGVPTQAFLAPGRAGLSRDRRASRDPDERPGRAFLADLTAEQGLDSAWLGATDEKSEGIGSGSTAPPRATPSGTRGSRTTSSTRSTT